jgi:endonuclease YncB( thermonuclease family)
MVFGETVSIETHGEDRYGRALGTIHLAGESVNERMVRDGFAWAYTRYKPPQAVVRAEADARLAKRGLWGDAKPVEPWVWRKTDKIRRRKALQES